MDKDKNCVENNLFDNQCFNKNDDEEIVISGISGKFPNSHNVSEFGHNLYSKIDMVDETERRWKHMDTRIPKRHGKVYDLDKFDASFFGVHNRQANSMDPQGRLLLEVAYESILDAGINPQVVRGRNIGCFVGVTFTEAEKYTYDDPALYNITGFVSFES